MPIEVNEIFIEPDTEKLAQNYDALHDLLTAQMDKAELSLENTSPTDILHLEQNLMSLLQFTPDKVLKLQKNDTFCKKHIAMYTWQQNWQLLQRCHRYPT